MDGLAYVIIFINYNMSRINVQAKVALVRRITFLEEDFTESKKLIFNELQSDNRYGF